MALTRAAFPPIRQIIILEKAEKNDQKHKIFTIKNTQDDTQSLCHRQGEQSFVALLTISQIANSERAENQKYSILFK